MMGTPYIGEIRMVGFDFAPREWAQCNGAIMTVQDHTALFSLLGTTFGGDGKTYFALPTLRGRTPIGEGNGYYRGYKAGMEMAPVVTSQMPSHRHLLKVSNENADVAAIRRNNDGLAVLVPSEGESAGPLYGGSTNNLQAMNPGSISTEGNMNSHYNMQPYLVINFCISLEGIYPSRN